MKNKISRADRNYGIDLLRIVAMFYVVILHIIGYGGVRTGVTDIISEAVVTFMKTGAFCAVNCYSLISGYVGYTEKKKIYRYSKYIEMWLQAVFYGVIGAGIFLLISPDLLYVKHLILGFFPVTCDQWWYFTAYSGLFFLTPWLNCLARNLSEKEMGNLIGTLLVVFSIYPTIASLYKEPFDLNEGYSMIWLIIMYLVGTWLKKNCVIERMNTRKWIVIGGICFLSTWLTKLVFELQGDFDTFFLQSYVSPTIICIAGVHLMLFSKMKITPKLQKWISFFSPATFGVYLFHMQWDILDNVITTKFSFIGQLPVWGIPFAILGCALSITTIGLMIDKIRGKIFEMLKIRNSIYDLEIKFREKFLTRFDSI